MLTLQDVAHFPRPGASTPAKIAYSPDGRWVTYLWSARGDLTRTLWAFDIATGRRRELFTPPGEGVTDANVSREEALRRERARLREFGITHYSWAKEAPVMAVPIRGDVYVWREGARTKAAERATDAKLSSDGSLLAFVRDGEVVANDRRLTEGAAPGLTHGLAEFIAQEEMHRDTGYWISPDAKWVAFEEVDERHIPKYPIVHQGKDAVEIEEHAYPFAGAENARIRLGVVSTSGGAARWIPLGEDVYLARVKWAPDGRLFVQVQSRDQRRLELRVEDRTLLIEESPHWVGLHHDLKFLPNGDFIWSSTRSGFRHLYLYGRDGTLIRQLTDGPWPVDAVLDLDEDRREVYFAAGVPSPLERHIFRVPLEGGKPERLTEERGMHDAVFAPDFSSFVEFGSNVSQPPGVTLRDRQGKRLAVIHEPGKVVLPPPEVHSFTTRDGTTLYAALYRSKRPGAKLIVSVYGGPGHQSVQDDWLLSVDMRAQYLSEQGFHVLKVDNRGSSRRGVAFETAIAGNLGDAEVRDQVEGVRWAASMGLDVSRVGIYGWSYGGYMALMGLCRAPEVFAAGVAGAPVTGWDGYDTHYTERYMRTPRTNPEGYRSSSVMTHVANLRGKLMLIHGMLDENVHFRHTARLIDALMKANKPHEILLYPNERHLPRSEQDRLAMEARIVEFFQKSLLH